MCIIFLHKVSYINLKNIIITTIAIMQKKKHIVVGDFNLHYPVWESYQYLNQHALANIFFEIIDNFNLDLAMKPDSIT